MSTATAATTPERTGARPTKAGPGSDVVVTVISHVALIAWSAIVLLPLLWTVITSFKSSEEINVSPFSMPKVWHFDNYTRAWNTIGIGKYFINTVIIVGIALVLVMMLGAMTAYVLSRYRFKGNKVVYYMILAGNTFPIFLAVVPLFFVLKNIGIVGTYQGLIIAYVAYAYPFTVFFLFSFFKNLPHEIYEAAQIDGAGEWRSFFQVMAPMAKPGLASVAIFNFLGLWNQFMLPAVLNQGPKAPTVLSQGLANMQAQQGYNVDYGGMFAGVVITVIPVLVMYIIFQRQLQGGVSQGTMK